MSENICLLSVLRHFFLLLDTHVKTPSNDVKEEKSHDVNGKKIESREVKSHRLDDVNGKKKDVKNEKSDKCLEKEYNPLTKKQKRWTQSPRF